MSMNFDTLFGPYQDKTSSIYVYDWVDLDSATGYVSYDGLAATDSTSTKYLLEKSSERLNLYSCARAVVQNVKFPNTWTELGDYRNLTKVIDVDFDTSTFKKARTIRGKAYFKIPIGTWGHTLAGSAITALYFIAKVRKWNGSTETEIISVQSPSAYTINEIDIKSYMASSVDIPETTIAINEQIRLTVEVYLDTTTDSAVGVGLGHDPQNEADIVNTVEGFPAYTSRLIFVCPFKIEAVTS